MALLTNGTLAPWLKGEVKRHCIRCEEEVGRLERACPRCGLPLRKECPACHYWGEIDRGYCLACRHSFPLPAPPKATVKIWHEESASFADGGSER
jgi:predicted amidophosphoribosyltransferase